MTRHDTGPERRRQIRAAAQRCFIAQGYAEARIDDVAREAGLSKGAVYWHYADKHELLMDMLTDWCARSAGVFATELARSRQTGPARIREALRVSAADTIARPGEIPLLIELFAGIPRDVERRALFNRSYGALRATWLEVLGQPAHLPARERRRRHSQAALLAGALSGLLLQWLADPDAVELDDATELVFELADRFAAATPRRGSRTSAGT